ncbi:MAG TPA: hypothetical protein VFV77_06370 [Gammaproteobacteria bacterium]|nr:hypothetical protein [Gammaproteobacteria bacterium]
MNAKNPRKRYGIRCTLPPDDPMSAPHLLGPDWEAYRWYDSEQERDEAIEAFSREHLYSRRGDKPSVIYAKVSR